MKRYVFFALFVGLALTVRAQQDGVTDSLPWEATADSLQAVYVPRVFLLTCGPGTEVWQLYGHTAIRFEDTERDVDVVFNYGLFDFAAPHFVWHFCLGQTDYIVGAEMYEGFEAEYAERGSTVTEQQLALTADEATRLWNLLTQNCRPEERTYRYDFFYNNCSTKARDIIYQSLDVPVGVARTDSVSLRTVLHRHNATYPWTSFGIDLLLGVEADRRVGHEVQEFAPLSLEESFAKATREGKNFVAGTAVVTPTAPLPKKPRCPLTPAQTMTVLLLLTAIVGTLELLTGRRFWGYDLLLYGTQGVAGLVVAFLFLFSTHPTVDSNILVTVLNPLILVLLPFLLRQSRRRTLPWAAWTEMGLILLLVVAWLIVRQDIPVAAWLFVASLFLRTGRHLLRSMKKKTER